MSIVSRGDLIQALASLVVTLLLMGAALFLSAGTLHWLHGLWFMAAFLILTLAAMVWLWRVNPEIFAARRRLTGQGTKGWDITLFFILLGGFLATLIVAGLDNGRFHWHPRRLGPLSSAMFYCSLAIGYGLGAGGQSTFRAQRAHPADRDHRVIATRPFAYVRHPGYTFAIILTFGIALALGSLWALLAAGLVAVVLVIRTILEDATLHRELSGYAEFASRTRHKLIPGVW